MVQATLPPPPNRTANPAPVRAANSVRRTSSIDVSWPDGEKGGRLFIGRVRDYLTTTPGRPGRVLGEAVFRARLSDDKTIQSISAEPTLPGIERLVGMRGGNHLRLFIKETMPDLITGGAPIYLALDDISGSALVSAWAWSHWNGDYEKRLREAIGAEGLAKMISDRANVCWGLKEGNSALQPERPTRDLAGSDAGDVRNPADPEGWHELYEPEGPGFRRARRIEVTHDRASGIIRVESAFQDSVPLTTGGRGAIHEYDLSVTIAADSLEILTIEPQARVLPFSECPGAIANAKRLVGSKITDVRDTVLAQLRGPEGCTHLNDALRALAEVPQLADYLTSEGI